MKGAYNFINEYIYKKYENKKSNKNYQNIL